MLIAIHLVILGLPLGGIAVLRVYESALIRQTESELIAQGVFISATYRTLLTRLAGQDTQSLGRERRFFEFRADPQGPWRPRLVSLDLASDPILPDPPEPIPVDLEPRAYAATVGAELEPILRDAQVNTLAGIRVVDIQGVIVATTGNDRGKSMSALEEVQRALQGEYVSLMRERGTRLQPPLDSISRGARIRVSVAVPILQGDRVLGAVTLLRTPANIWQAIRGKRRELIVGAATLIAIALSLSAFTALTIAQPVRAVTRQAQRAARGESGAVTPLRHAGTKEVAALSRSVASMAAALEARATYIRDFAAQVSHEFKTPLTAIRGTVELMRDHGQEMEADERERFLSLLDADAIRLDRLVRRLLELARADMSSNAEAPSRGNALAVIDKLSKRFGERGLELSLQVPDVLPPIALGDDMLDAILGGLLDNALQHAGESVQVSITACLQSEKLLIDVADDGPGLSPHNAERMFEPFFTTARDQGNTGMGLAIARSLLRSHDGDICLLPSAHGACLRIEIPIASPAHS